jgi:plastocyanin
LPTASGRRTSSRPRPRRPPRRRIQPHHHELDDHKRGQLAWRREHCQSLGTLDDQLAFTANQETAKAGKVTVDFTNNAALGHDVVLVDSQNKILGQTPVFQGGSKSLTATLAPGTYTYYCSVPGHRQAGMQGTLTVK